MTEYPVSAQLGCTMPTTASFAARHGIRVAPVSSRRVRRYRGGRAPARRGSGRKLGGSGGGARWLAAGEKRPPSAVRAPSLPNAAQQRQAPDLGASTVTVPDRIWTVRCRRISRAKGAARRARWPASAQGPAAAARGQRSPRQAAGRPGPALACPTAGRRRRSRCGRCGSISRSVGPARKVGARWCGHARQVFASASTVLRAPRRTPRPPSDADGGRRFRAYGPSPPLRVPRGRSGAAPW